MALSTYAELQASVADWATYSDVTVQIPDFIALADLEIARRLRANVLLASASLTLSAETISQPTGFLAFRRVYLDTTPRRALETISAEGAMDLSSQLVTSTYPTHVAVEGTLLRFAPLFSGTTTTATCAYYKRQTAMSAASDTNVVLAKYPYLYLFGALEALYSFKEDDNNAGLYGEKFGALIEQVNASEAKDMMSGPLSVQNYRGRVV